MRLRIVASVLALDALTKTFLVTPDWAFHERASSWRWMSLFGVLFFAGAMLFREILVGAALLFAGTFANLLDSFDGIRNPFVFDFGHGLVAFNLADVALYAGGVALWCSLVLMIGRSLRQRRLA